MRQIFFQHPRLERQTQVLKAYPSQDHHALVIDMVICAGCELPGPISGHAKLVLSPPALRARVVIVCDLSNTVHKVVNKKMQVACSNALVCMQRLIRCIGVWHIGVVNLEKPWKIIFKAFSFQQSCNAFANADSIGVRQPPIDTALPVQITIHTPDIIKVAVGYEAPGMPCPHQVPTAKTSQVTVGEASFGRGTNDYDPPASLAMGRRTSWPKFTT